jgi:uncharacterized membrane protein YdjX (TVP38/TMEM64 family)
MVAGRAASACGSYEERYRRVGSGGAARIEVSADELFARANERDPARTLVGDTHMGRSNSGKSVTNTSGDPKSDTSEVEASATPVSHDAREGDAGQEPVTPLTETTVLSPAQTRAEVARALGALFWFGMALYGSVLLGALLLKRMPPALQKLAINVYEEPSIPAALVLPAVVGAAGLAFGIVLQIGAERLRAAVAFLRALGPAGLLAAGALFLPPLGSLVLFWQFPAAGAWLRGHEALGIVIYVSAFAVLAGLALLPTYAQSALGGFAFGMMFGVPAALGGFVGGAFIGYLVASRVSGDRVDKALANKPKMRAVRDALVGRAQANEGHAFLKTFGTVALLRLPPNSPFALTNLLLASSKVPILPFLLGTAVGMLPRTALAVVVGAGVHDALSKEALEQATPRWVWFVGIAVTLGIVAVFGRIANKAIERVAAEQAKEQAKA